MSSPSSNAEQGDLDVSIMQRCGSATRDQSKAAMDAVAEFRRLNKSDEGLNEVLSGHVHYGSGEVPPTILEVGVEIG